MQPHQQLNEQFDKAIDTAIANQQKFELDNDMTTDAAVLPSQEQTTKQQPVAPQGPSHS